MKKILLGMFVMFLCTFTVYASSKGPSEIKMEGINLTGKDTVAYNGTVSISYELNPKDADNKNITWTASKVNGVTTTFDCRNTNASSGTVKVTFNNKNNEPVDVTITATDSTKKITKSIKVTVYDEQSTTALKDKAKEIEDLIKTLDNKVTKENYSKVEKTLGDIDTLFKANDENVKDYVDSALMIRYDDVKSKFENYKEASSMAITAGTIVTIVILALTFIFGLFVIFKKEEK